MKTTQKPLPNPERNKSHSLILPLGRVQPHRQTAIAEVDQHPKVVRLDAVRYGLKRIHFERCLRLELIEGAIIRTKPELPVLFRDHENWRLEVPKRSPGCLALNLRSEAGRVVGAQFPILFSASSEVLLFACAA